MDAQIIGVSSDSSEKNVQFAQKNGITFPLVSDKDKTIKKLYGRGWVTYIIDKSGVIQFVKKGVPENEELMKVLRQLQ